jgi:ABC-2 type transport system permease protein
VTSNENARPLGASAEAEVVYRDDPLTYLKGFITKVLVITELEARKLRHDPTELLTRAIQPMLWLLVFGEVLTAVRAIPTGDIPYIDFMTPGVLAQSVLFISIFYGISIVWERDLGIVQKFLASPVPRTSIVAGKALSSGLRSLSQALIVFLLAAAIGVSVITDPINLALVVVVVLLGAAIFATLSLIIACLVKTRDRFIGIGQMITMPLFFASNAIYPISLAQGYRLREPADLCGRRAAGPDDRGRGERVRDPPGHHHTGGGDRRPDRHRRAALCEGGPLTAGRQSIDNGG